MSDRPRIHRPKLERHEPIRSWSTSAANASTEPEPARGNESPVGDAIARSVDLAYRVVDDYLRQGERAARGFGGRTAPLGTAIPDLYARWARSMSDFAGTWLDLFGAGAGAFSEREPDRPAEPPGAEPATEPDPGREPVRSELPAVVVDVRAECRVSVELELRPGIQFRTLAVHDLREADSAKPRLRALIDAASDAGRLRVVVDVPRGQPAGRYSGLLLDAEASLPVGTLSVRVGEP
jgi:hypothetical protein